MIRWQHLQGWNLLYAVDYLYLSAPFLVKLSDVAAAGCDDSVTE